MRTRLASVSSIGKSFRVTGRRGAQRRGYRTAKLFGGPVDPVVRRHFLRRYARHHLAYRLTERYLVAIWINDSAVFHTVVANPKRVGDLRASRNELGVVLVQARDHDVNLGGDHGSSLW